MTDPTWPTVEDATRRINVLIEGQVEGPEADMAARDLIVVMRELGRVTNENRRLREALKDFVKWSEAYPTTIFVEPDLKRAHELLQVGGMTLDAVSASVMRFALKGIGERARAAASPEGE